jgi:hypothetical protein
VNLNQQHGFTSVLYRPMINFSGSTPRLRSCYLGNGPARLILFKNVFRLPLAVAEGQAVQPNPWQGGSCRRFLLEIDA